MNRQHQIIGSEVGRNHTPGLLSIRAYPPARRIDWYQAARMALQFGSVAFTIWLGWGAGRLAGWW